MEAADYLGHLDRDHDAFVACLHRDLSTPVPHCGDWTLHDLADHLGRGNLWATAAVRERRGDRRGEPAPRAAAELITWFDETAATLRAALDTAPSTEAWTFFPPHTVGFWQRRRCLESFVHRWDAQSALGMDAELDPTLAADGVAEVIEVMVPAMTKRGRISAPDRAVNLTATDAGSSWTLGPGDPVARLSAPAGDLLLLLWGRRATAHPSIGWEGDRAAAEELFARPLVP